MDLQGFLEAMRQHEPFLNNRDQCVCANRDPDFRFHVVFTGAEKYLDAQALLDLLEAFGG